MWLLQGGVLECGVCITSGVCPAFPLSLLHCFEPLWRGQFPVLLIFYPRPPAFHPGHLLTSLHWLSDAQTRGGCFSLPLPTPTLAFEKQKSLSHSWPTGRQRGGVQEKRKRGVGGLSWEARAGWACRRIIRDRENESGQQQAILGGRACLAGSTAAPGRPWFSTGAGQALMLTRTTLFLTVHELLVPHGPAPFKGTVVKRLQGHFQGSQVSCSWYFHHLHSCPTRAAIHDST